MARFFVSKANINDQNISISGEDYNHIKKVLRLNVGDNITLCDGEGTDYLSVIQKFEKDYVLLGIQEVIKNENEPKLQVELYQGVPKSDKMDLIIQKAVELGIYKIVPVITERTVVKIDSAKDAAKKVERWQRIAEEAAKQCQRGIVPKVELPMKFDNAILSAKESQLAIIPFEKESQNGIKRVISGFKGEKVSVFIGPEGGFADSEIEKALKMGINSVTLGPRILRTETAGIAVLSILMYELGDVGI